MLVTATHYVTALNPFQDSDSLLGLVLAVVVQLLLIRKRGLVYICGFMGSLLLLFLSLSWVEQHFFDQPRRYYSKTTVVVG